MSSENKSLPHIFLLGATGRTGRSLMTEALSRGYTITAQARNPESLSNFTDTSLTVVKGTPTSTSDLISALQTSVNAAQARNVVIISTLGQTRASGNPFSAATSPPLFMSQSIAALFAAIKELPDNSRSHIDKLIIMSMFGAGDSFPNLHFAIRPIMRYSSMLQTVDDHTAIDRLVRGQSDVNWVMVRPSMLKEGDKKPVVIRDDNGSGEGFMPSSTTSGTVVDFLLGCVTSKQWDLRSPVIVN